MDQRRAVAFGRRHPRLTGLLNLLLTVPLLLLAVVQVEDGLLLGLSALVGASFGIALVAAGHRMKGWAAVPFFGFVVVAGLLIDGYRDFPRTELGAAALFSLCLCFTILGVALVAGLRRTPQAE